MISESWYRWSVLQSMEMGGGGLRVGAGVFSQKRAKREGGCVQGFGFCFFVRKHLGASESAERGNR